MTTTRWRRVLRIAAYAGFFAYLVFVRTYRIDQTFWLLGEQIRDWRIAMGSFSALPLTGTPSTAGGATLGPIYYWTIWLIRVTIGPFFSNLPHAGGIGLALIQSGADLLLLYSASRRFRSPGAAFVAVLLAATSPYDMTLTAALWNPPLAVALSKIAVALLWLPVMSSPGRGAIIVAVSWLAVQAHTAAILIALPIIGFVVLRCAWTDVVGAGLRAARNAIEVIVLLQIPYAVHHWTHPVAGEASAITQSIGYTLTHPAAMRVTESARLVGTALDFILFQPYNVPALVYMIAGLAVVAGILWWREPDVLITTVVPLAAAVAAFAVWRGPLTEYYWFLPIAPSAALVLLLAAGKIGVSPVRSAVLIAAGLLVIWAQPARCRASWEMHKVPQYGSLIRASRQLVKQAPELRAISAPWLPKSSDAAFLYEILGGRISQTAPLEAYIDPEGTVTYRAATGQVVGRSQSDRITISAAAARTRSAEYFPCHCWTAILNSAVAIPLAPRTTCTLLRADS